MNMLYLLIILIPAFISTMFIPYWTRRTESFGVSIPEEIYHTDKIKKLREQYVLFSGFASIILTVILLGLGSLENITDNNLAIYFTVLIFLYLIGTFFIYLYFHRIMKQLKRTENWGKEKPQQVFIDTEFRKQKLTHSNLWFSISFIITFATIALTFVLYERIPEQIPTQYNFNGEVTTWTEKSPRSVLLMPIMSLYMTILFMFINTMITKAKQQISAENPKESMQQNIIFRRRWSAFLILTGTASTLLFSFIQLSFIYPMDTQWLTIVPIIFGVVVTAGAIFLSITTGQGGSRVKLSTGSNGKIIDRDDDKYWKLGMFYFNKNDPALFLEKRFGVGWTINLARPVAWIIFLVIILASVGIPLLLS